MSPREMAAASRCARNCPHCTKLARARRDRALGWLFIVLALAAIVASLPVGGLPGAGLGLGGIALVWTGWHFVVRRGAVR